MSGSTPLDILSVPLRGTHLIEASAGTGKTFTIANLVLRLVVEGRLDIGRILAVTFTESATRELRDRIRRILNQAQTLIDAPDTGDQSVAAAVVRQAVGLSDRQTVAKALRKAILSFDEAGIFTIHGFCNRILNQFAFESSLPFNLELVTDQSRFVREVVDDFWRRNFSRAPRLLCAVAMKRSLSCEDLIGFAGLLINKPMLVLIPPAVDGDPSRQLLQAFDDARALWEKERGRILDLLKSDDYALRRTRETFRKEAVEEYAAGLDRLFNEDIDTAGLALIGRLTPDFMRQNRKPSKAHLGIPEHPFFDRCQRYVAAEDACAVYYRHVFRHYLEQELARRKQDFNVQYFSDLLSGLQKALKADRQGRLASAIREKYRAVLIDEFQDTDPVQYEIFDRLFNVDSGCLFLIGDPKQSIFAFRSADVFSYIRAATSIPPAGRYALPWNWRSETSLVEAVNHLFGRAVNPFVLGEAIGFNAVNADQNNVGNRQPLRIDDRKAGNVELWFIGKAGEDGHVGALNRTRARSVVIDAVADEIARLLNLSARGAVRIGESPLGPADIAVLITRNQDAGRIKDRLAALNIPAVISRTGGVFSTAEALAVERVLTAMAAPGNFARINAALADDLIGCSADDIRGFAEDDARHDEYEDHLRRFAEYHRLWQTGGFIRVFRRFMSDYHVRVRLLGFPNGERRLTNVLHLSELIHQAAVEYRLGMNGLLDWVAERRGADEETLDEEQLRLERDDEAVQIVTIWKSKGLQYPVVFCPFMWDKGAAVRAGGIVFHDDHNLTLDIGTADADHIRAAGRENLSELVRLLYVGATRAINRCYLVYGKIGDPGKSGVTSLDYLLTGGRPDDAVCLDDLQAQIKALDAEALYHRVVEQLGDRPDLIRVGLYEPIPSGAYHPADAPEQEALQQRVFTGGRINQEWGIASFTHLAARSRAASSPPDDGEIKRDEFFEKTVNDGRVPGDTIFDFPAGATPGLCIHSIFERLDFSLSSPENIRQLIDSALRQYGLDKPSPAGTPWTDTVYRMVSDVLRAPVLPHDRRFTLGGLSRDSLITEMAFYYPVSRITSGKIRAALQQSAGDGDERQQDFSGSCERLEFKPLHGYMRGFIDLVFTHDGKYYLLDWKTNHLGYDYGSYGFPRLRQSVIDASYYLQYYIYTVALHRYLGHRLPDYDYDAHFGGVVYLFVRGINPDLPGNGVYFDRPARTLADSLSRALG